MKYCAKGIRKFQRELKTSVSEFPQFGLLGRKMPEEFDSENYQPDSSSCTQIQKELEDYRLQELAEDPYRIQLEDDPTKEQEEYFRRIRQEWMDPGCTEQKMEHKEDNTNAENTTIEFWKNLTSKQRRNENSNSHRQKCQT